MFKKNITVVPGKKMAFGMISRHYQWSIQGKLLY